MPFDASDNQWHPTGAITSLTDNSGGTADDTIAAVSGSGDDATINNNFADLAAKVEEILDALRESGDINK